MLLLFAGSSPRPQRPRLLGACASFTPPDRSIWPGQRLVVCVCLLPPWTPLHSSACCCRRARDCAYRGTSNIVFTNGALDPWSVFGVTTDVSDSVVAVLIPDGAHHLDLMYATPQDSEDLKVARQTIMAHVARWVRQAAPAAAGGEGGGAGGGLRWQAMERTQQQ